MTRAFDIRDNLEPHAIMSESSGKTFGHPVIHSDMQELVETVGRRYHVQEMKDTWGPGFLKSNTQVKDLLRFDSFVSDFATQFINVPPEEVDGRIAGAIERVRAFFEADGCGLFESVPEGPRIQPLFVCNNQRPLPAIIARLESGHPWAYQRLMEQGKPILLFPGKTVPAQAAELARQEYWGTPSLVLLPVTFEAHRPLLLGIWSELIEQDWSLLRYTRLSLIGEIFAKALSHKRDQEALLKERKIFAEAQRIARVGSWEWDILSGELCLSDETYRIFGLSPHQCHITYDVFLAAVPEADRAAVEQAVRESLSPPYKPYSIEHRVIPPDRSERIVYECGELVRDASGKPRRMIGAVLDITDRKKKEASLRTALEELKIYKERLEAENVYLKDEISMGKGLPFIIGDSSAIKYVMHRIKQVSKTDATVLLLGETGTGKGVFARAIHELSDRKDKPFIHVNCAGLPSNLIESELFGREKGAFTGSTARQIGRFELASGGTIFLDEIGELPLELQPKLLKVLEDGEFERLGSPHSVKADVRVIASTNRDLIRESGQGLFRMDLFYRLNVFPVTIPSLNQRKTDIPLFVNFFVKRLSDRYRKDIKRIPENTMKALAQYDWPGNVRELINVIERAVIVSDGTVLRLAEKIAAQPFCPAQEKLPDAGNALAPKDIFEVERAHILGALHQTGGRISGKKGAATLLGLHANTLRSRMIKLGIKKPRSAA